MKTQTTKKSQIETGKNIDGKIASIGQSAIVDLSVPFGKQMNDKQFEQLLKNLGANKNIQILKLANQGINGDRLKSISEFAKQSATLKELHLDQNGIKTDQDKDTIVNMIQNSPHLTTLNLKQNSIDHSSHYEISQIWIGEKDSLELFGQQVALSLKELQKSPEHYSHLNLFGENIGDAGCIELANILQGNKTLTHIWLTRNGINDAGFNSLFNALTSNETVRTLHIDQNKMTDISGQKLLELIEAKASKGQKFGYLKIDKKSESQMDSNLFSKIEVY
jgi:hypothetical protein